MRYVFDLDGTLCSSSPGAYRLAQPIEARIKIVNQLYDMGHYVHIFTARGMSTYRGNRVRAQIRWRRVTKRQLKNWGVRYHKLTLGKPSGEIYVDDKACHSDIFFNREAAKWDEASDLS